MVSRVFANHLDGLIDAGRWAEAEAVGVANLASETDGATAAFAIARCWHEKGLYPEAIEGLRCVLAFAEPVNWLIYPQVIVLVVRWLIEFGEADAALALCREEIARRPFVGPARRCLGVLLQMRGDRRGAALAFRQALLLDPDDRLAAAGLSGLPEESAANAAAGAAALAAFTLPARWPWAVERQQKPLGDPRRIAVILATRARVDKLSLMLRSIDQTVSRPDLVDVALYVDDDDRETLDFLAGDAAKALSFRVTTVRGARRATFGAMLNALWHGCETAGFYLGFADDFTFVTQGWDEIIRTRRLAEGQNPFMGYILEIVDQPLHITIVGASDTWCNACGYFLPDYFPFWFTDTWVSHIGQLTQRRFNFQIDVEPIDGRGKTGNMRELAFWTDFFHESLVERVDMAQRLRHLAYTGDPEAFWASQAMEAELIAFYRASADDEDQDSIADTEQRLRAEMGTPQPRYLAAKARAERYRTDVLLPLFNPIRERFSKGNQPTGNQDWR